MGRWTSVAVCVAMAAGAAGADPGQIEINESCAEVGCFPGDKAGYPVTITAPGSYRLTSNLTPAAKSAIEIHDSDVQLDLGGFVVRCQAAFVALSGTIVDGTTQAPTAAPEPPPVPEPGSTACPGEVDGIGGAGDNIRISNGTVRNFGSSGIDLDGRGARIFDVAALGNGYRGIDLQGNDHAVVRDALALDNGSSGIILGEGSMIRDSVAGNNGGGALSASLGSQIRDSVSRGNHNGATTGGHGLIHGLVTTENNYGFSPGVDSGRGLVVSGDNAVSDSSGFVKRLDCVLIGSAVNCP